MKRRIPLMTLKAFKSEKIGLLATNPRQYRAKIRGRSGASGLSSRYRRLAKSRSFKLKLRWEKTLRDLETLKRSTQGIKIYRTGIILRSPRESDQRHIDLSKFPTLKPLKAKFQTLKSLDIMIYRIVLATPCKQCNHKGSNRNSRQIKAVWKPLKTATS